MVRYTIERILLAILTTVIILTLTFFLMKLLPFDPGIGTDTAKLTYYLDQANRVGNLIDSPTPRTDLGDPLWYIVDSGNVAHYFYLRPAIDLFVIWVRGIFTSWNWGASIFIMPNVDSMILIRDRIGVTMLVNIWPALISVPLGIALGIWAALKKNTMTDHIISTLVMIFISIPSFIIITFLMLILAYNTG